MQRKEATWPKPDDLLCQKCFKNRKTARRSGIFVKFHSNY